MMKLSIKINHESVNQYRKKLAAFVGFVIVLPLVGCASVAATMSHSHIQ